MENSEFGFIHFAHLPPHLLQPAVEILTLTLCLSHFSQHNTRSFIHIKLIPFSPRDHGGFSVLTEACVEFAAGGVALVGDGETGGVETVESS
jgi:hypothetical protein